MADEEQLITCLQLDLWANFFLHFSVQKDVGTSSDVFEAQLDKATAELICPLVTVLH